MRETVRETVRDTVREAVRDSKGGTSGFAAAGLPLPVFNSKIPWFGI
jgi:hypothetical protein